METKSSTKHNNQLEKIFTKTKKNHDKHQKGRYLLEKSVFLVDFLGGGGRGPGMTCWLFSFFCLKYKLFQKVHRNGTSENWPSKSILTKPSGATNVELE